MKSSCVPSWLIATNCSNGLNDRPTGVTLAFEEEDEEEEEEEEEGDGDKEEDFIPKIVLHWGRRRCNARVIRVCSSMVSGEREADDANDEEEGEAEEKEEEGREADAEERGGSIASNSRMTPRADRSTERWAVPIRTAMIER